MSLDWKVDKIENFEELVWLPNDDGETFHLNPVTNVLIWMTMSVGMNKITEENWPVFLGRVAALEGANGSWVFIDIDAEDVEAHVGLSTNASNMTAAAFEKKILDEMKARKEKAA